MAGDEGCSAGQCPQWLGRVAGAWGTSLPGPWLWATGLLLFPSREPHGAARLSCPVLPGCCGGVGSTMPGQIQPWCRARGLP